MEKINLTCEGLNDDVVFIRNEYGGEGFNY